MMKITRDTFRKISPKQALIAAALATSILAGGIGGAHYYQTGRFMISTDDAYLKADSTTISPKVSGYIGSVLVEDNQTVEAGAVLARIDDRDFQTALSQAEADVDTAQADIAGIDARIQLQQAMVGQAEANLAADKAALDFAGQERNRYQALLKTGYGTVQRAQSTEADLRSKTALLARDQAGLSAARHQIDVLQADRNRAGTVLEQKNAALDQARHNLDYTVIRAPIDGTVGARSVRPGQYVQAGTQLMAVVPLQSVYVVANFKETQLARMNERQRVTVSVDGLGGAKIQGSIDSLSPASGQEFSLLPPDNATGNFTKIVQRVPVKIVLDVDQPFAGRLRPGMSVTAVVDTRATTQLAERPTRIGATVAAR
jgi:membrane fusion protein (multidrug efflux system)